MKAMILVLVSVFFMLSCTFMGTVKPSMHKADFKAYNEPIRTLRVLVLTGEDSPAQENIGHFIHKEISPLLERQVGIRLRIVNGPLQAGSFIDDWIGQPEEMRDFIGKTYASNKFDIAIAFPGPSAMSTLGVGKSGSIDDTWRRYIVLRNLDKCTGIREIFHCFVFSHKRSLFGNLAPAVLPGICTVYLSEEDREEVLWNKWRDFSKAAYYLN
jgi:hypothetical protein